MAVTVQMQFESGVTERYEDALSGSSIAQGTTIMPCDLRTLALHRVLETPSTSCWGKAPDAVEVHELSTCHHPIQSRFSVAPGSSLNDQHQRRYFTPASQGGSTSQPRSHSVLRLAGALAGVCGGRRRHLALLWAALCLLPRTKASIKRWLADLGSQ
jgi:hypothetical protein